MNISKIFIIFSLFVLPLFSHASFSQPASITSAGIVTFDISSIQPNEGWQRSSLDVFKGTYPSGSNIGGQVVGSDNSQTRKDIFNFWCTVSSPQADCDIEATFGSIYGDGDYWVQFHTPNNTTPTIDVYWFLFTRSSGVWSSTAPNTPDFQWNTTEWYQSGIKNGSVTSYSSSTSQLGVEALYLSLPSEFNPLIPELNPTSIRYCWTLKSATTTDFSCQSLAPVIQSDTISTQTDTLITTIPDGTYEMAIDFTNANCTLTNQNCPFPDSYIILEFTIENQELTAQQLLETYTPQQLNSTTSRQYANCTLSDVIGCAQNLLIFLFVPSENAITQIVNNIKSTNVPLVANATQAFTQITTFTQTTSADAHDAGYSLDLALPMVGTTTVFSFALLSQGMGDTAGTFRIIALLALYIGFLYMIINSINNMVEYKSSDKAHF